MSYILDALKKSQRQRELGSVPRLTTEQLVAHRRGSGIVPWAVAGAALATAAVLVALYGPFGRPPVARTDRTTTPGAEVSPPTPSVDTPQPAPRGTVPVAAEDGQGTVPAPLPAAVPADSTDVPDVVRARAVAAPETVRPGEIPAPDEIGTPAATNGPVAKAEVAVPTGSPAAETQPGTASVADDGVQSVPLLSELSFDLQRSLPALALNVHVYAQLPKDRFVFLNMQKYREGERTREGVLIEEITPEGVVLRRGQQRFRLVY